MDDNKQMHEALSKPDNDHNFKMHVLSKLDSIEERHKALDLGFKVFKIKAFAFIAALVSGIEIAAKSYFK